MSRKHFIAIAKAISEIADAADRAKMAGIMAKVCRDENPGFDIARFYKACNVERSNG